MNGLSKKGGSGVAAMVAVTLALVVSVYAVCAVAEEGAQPSTRTVVSQGAMMRPGMMGHPQGAGGCQGMKPGMIGHPQGMRACQGMKPSKMGSHKRAGNYQRMRPGMMRNHAGPPWFQRRGPRGMDGHRTGWLMRFAKWTTDTVSVENYLANIKTRLAITTAQEAAWNAYAQAFLEQVTSRIDRHNMARAGIVQTPMVRAEQRLKAMETMIARKKAHFHAFKTLYTQLGEQQRIIADRLP